MGVALGPDLWGNAPSKSAPVVELRAWLETMRAAVDAWTPQANENLWRPRFDGVRAAIDAALVAMPAADVFARPEGLRLYDTACNRYQDTKDQFVLSPDWLLTISEQAGVSPVAPDLFDKLCALLRSLGIGLAGAAVLLIVVVILVRKATG
jgi:hypothetical protein